MELSPEEKNRIYEEEKARMETRERIKRERQKISDTTSTGLLPNVAGALCYIGGWISGIIFFILEERNSWVRFHAAQSIVVFGTITFLGTVFGLIPVVGSAFSSIIFILGFILWIILMSKAYGGERYKLPFAGDIAEKMVESIGAMDTYQKTEPITDADLEKPIRTKGEIISKRDARITASAFAIACSFVLLIFFNFFNDYVAYYHLETVRGITTWIRLPLFTSDISLWLPILNTTLVITIVSHIVLIVLDRYILREVLQIVMDAFGLATVATLLSVFPFDFNVIPNTIIADSAHFGVTIALIFISLGVGIGILVRSIKLIVNMARGITDY
ncbi:MAG: DUF4870 domain-containing protein [Methanocellales archaeon]|nr:DUF4870 domain-containing protein [Methanocellales archaeon]MDD3291030.1 DUF4870 domain-containing protein [Methanocellales archaeon]MDD5234915.1 DUF4870 domain-containing protein [Methanocellales archaeon]MDD5484715.1 DUF4870 domain-containing protein [Methanocellales archaeon]